MKMDVSMSQVRAHDGPMSSKKLGKKKKKRMRESIGQSGEENGKSSSKRRKSEDKAKDSRMVRIRTHTDDPDATTVLTSFPSSSSYEEKGNVKELGMFVRKGGDGKRVVYSKTREMEYEGRNFGKGEKMFGKLNRCLVFRYNPDRNEAVLMNPNLMDQYPIVMKNTVLNPPEPKLPKDPQLELMDSDVVNLNAAAGTSSKGASRHKSLVSTFGSQKKQRKMIEQQVNRISASSATLLSQARQAFETGAKSNAKQLATDAETKARKALLPPFHMDANNVTEVYLLEELITDSERPDLLQAVKVTCKELKDKVALSVPIKHRYIQFRFAELASNPIPSKGEFRKVVGVLLYMSILMDFFNLPRKLRFVSLADIERKMPGTGKSICKRLINEFTEGYDTTTRLKTERSQDRLVLWILALILIMEDFSVSSEKITQLAATFQKPVKWVTQHFLELGCKTAADKGGGKKLQLRVPLQFPKISRGKK